MDFEPQTFFIGVTDLFSILMPGAFLTYYFYRRVRPCALKLDQWQIAGAEGWVIFLFSSYLLGHFLFFIGSWLDDFLYDPVRKATVREQISRLANGRKLSPRIARSLAQLVFKDKPDDALEHVLRLRKSYLQRVSAPGSVNAFQWCKAHLGVQKPETLAVISRFEADSKFFRSFVPVMLIVIVLEVRFQRDGWSLWSCLAMIAIVLALLRYMEQRFKSTQQAYWLVLSLEASKAAPIPAASSQSAAVGEAALTHAGGVVFRKRKSIAQFLMVQAKKDPNDWVLPKGHIEQGEEPRCCAIREVKEETGVWAGIVKELKPVEYEFEGKPVRVLFYLMEAIDHGNVQDPLREHEWLPLEDALHRTKYPSTAELLAVAGKELGLS